jgi:hypothetical protein
MRGRRRRHAKKMGKGEPGLFIIDPLRTAFLGDAEV